MASPLGPVRWNKINVLRNVKRTVLCPAFRSKILFLIEQSWNASLDEVVAAMNDFHLLIWTTWKYAVGRAASQRAFNRWEERQKEYERIGLHNNMDLTTSLGLKRARDFCDVTAPRYLHLSPVCGPTSPLQELNMRTEEQREKL